MEVRACTAYYTPREHDHRARKAMLQLNAMACRHKAVGNAGRRNSDSTAAGVSKRAKLPAKNPMVLQKQNGSYYRVRVLEEKAQQVKIGVSRSLLLNTVCLHGSNADVIPVNMICNSGTSPSLRHAYPPIWLVTLQVTPTGHKHPHTVAGGCP